MLYSLKYICGLLRL